MERQLSPDSICNQVLDDSSVMVDKLKNEKEIGAKNTLAPMKEVIDDVELRENINQNEMYNECSFDQEEQ